MDYISVRDKKVIWHPFTHIKNAPLPVTITKGEGAYLIDDAGNKYIDSFSSWWVNLHGHSNLYIAEKIYEQAKQLEHAAFSNFTHIQAVTLAERLLRRLPSNQAKIFYSDNGSTAVEVAIKMAIQYHYNTGKPKTAVIAFENGYHGDTFGAMSVAERNVFNKPFNSFLFNVVHIPVPVNGKEQTALSQLKEALKRDDICAFIFEPLVQGAGGMVMYEPAILNEILEVCKKEKCITIADEVMTGFGRTGKFLASDHISQQADIVCLSKGITGGFMPLGVTSCSQQIHDAFISDDKNKTFYHGHSYTGNPIACAAANASLDLLEKPETWEQIERIVNFFSKMKKRFENNSSILDCRQRGTILAMELKTIEGTSYLNPLSERLTAFYFKRGIIVRPLGNILYFIPPYCINEAQLKQIESVTNEMLNCFPGL